jgi:lipopolysaccharide heptosyltransferase II
MSRTLQRILVIQTAFIGDVVLATGILEKLHAYYPAAELDFLVRAGNEGLLKGHPFLNKVYIWEKRQQKYKNLLKLIKEVRTAKYDLVVNLQRFAASGLITATSGAKETVGFEKNPLSRLLTHSLPHEISASGTSGHEYVRNHALIRHLTDEEPAKPKLYPSIADEAKAEPYRTGVYLTMAPSSVWFTKQYPPERWIDLLRTLPDGQLVYLLGGKEDEALCQQIRQAVPGKNVVNLAGRLNLLQSAALMRTARMNFTNDSAPMHLASAMNAPTTAIFCSTVPEFGFGPLADTRYIVQTSKRLACKPCTFHGRKACPLGHYNCAHTIRVEQLLEGLE